jgi:hypothetical protein
MYYYVGQWTDESITPRETCIFFCDKLKRIIVHILIGNGYIPKLCVDKMKEECQNAKEIEKIVEYKLKYHNHNLSQSHTSIKIVDRDDEERC